MSRLVSLSHPDFAVLTVSWELALRADTPRLWLGSRGRPALAADGVDAMLKRRGADAGISGLHPHAIRHT
jgi:site-specific recombinase XerD